MVKKYGVGLIVGLGLVCLMLLLPALAQDRAEWAKAKAEFNQKCDSRDANERASVATALGEAMYSKVEPEAVKLLIGHLNNEVARAGIDGTHDERVKYVVIEAVVNALKKVTEEKAINSLLKSAKNRNLNWRVRFYVIRALVGINHPEVNATLVELLDDKEPKIQIAALDSLGDLRIEDGAERACKLLNEPITWEVKVAATDYLSKLTSDESLIESVIQALEGENVEGRVKAEIVNVLKKLTGVDKGLEASAWRTWWEKKKAGVSDDNPASGKEETTAVYYGVKVSSTRMVFIFDISGSMDWAAKWKEEPEDKPQREPIFTDPKGKPARKQDIEALKKKKEEVDKREVNKRIDAAKRELINTIYSLSPKVFFTIIFYSTGIKAWKEELIPATVANKTAAIEEVDKQNPMGATNIYDALELAYKIHETGKGRKKKVQVDKKSGYAKVLGGADTIFLVTDGNANWGKIPNAAGILEEIKKLNETRKIKINTVAVGGPQPGPQQGQGDPGPDVDFLRRLAEITGGIFVDRSSR